MAPAGRRQPVRVARRVARTIAPVTISAPPRVMAAVAAADIEAGAADLGLQLTREQADQLARFCALLTRWNSVHNLTAIESPREVLTHHVLDCLAVVPALTPWTGKRTLDVLDGVSGAGLPGIPLAIALPGARVTLIDRVQKK